MITREKVQEIFSHLKTDSQKFFDCVSENVSWEVMGTHPLAGQYNTKDDFFSHTFKRLNAILKEGVILTINHIFLDGNTAIVEMTSLSVALNGKPFSNKYCWIVKFSEETIVSVRAYLDSALVSRTLLENE